ncbi:hypothetical protein KIN20_028139 [Parelaphostrongylus tenuis]|uniref:Uncharacterized protein n=1 Tax=Parelaphostrongylus tenuis TaxID=148309 RepID=A0AAD5WEE9_PARTN|nr:hypothetical protein KIN20_028139 [Parelaphostrongylus tenuis]
MAAIVVNSLLTGYFYLVGANYCHCPMLMYITGAIVLGWDVYRIDRQSLRGLHSF